ncbi:MAG: hypothetical protein JWN44_7138 [Myxococcales bacterium]|nr:hypothetical protein [Myxococcales bacterium]
MSAHESSPPPGDPGATNRRYQQRHLRVGWMTLLLFATLGTLLELLHAFKVPAYLGVATESRRFMWTLAHAHGAALALVNLALAAVCHLLPRPLSPVASASLVAGTILVPGGFLVGGLFVHGGDPGLGAILIPPGALCIVVALALIARASLRPR